MKPHRLLTAICISFLTVANAQTIVPGWFEELPEASSENMLAVGYCGVYIDQSLARQAALNRAFHNMAKQQQAHLVYDIEELSDGRLVLMNPSLEISVEESKLDKIKRIYTAIDSSITEDGYFIIISIGKDVRLPGKITNDKTWSNNRPEWTSRLPKSKHYNYGVGIVSNYSSWVRGWCDADDFARFDLGKNLKIAARSTHAKERDNRYIIESKILHQSYDEIVSGAVIIARWYDSEKDIYYSLCRQEK
jgi:hypothetical protein